MRDYVQKQSQFRSQTRAWTAVWQVVRNMVNRRALRKLEELSDHELKDIGLTRSDLYYVLKLPVTCDPIWEMDRLRMISARRGLVKDES
jgi:uncharacterized protein YjiS (DUF1127 family)